MQSPNGDPGTLRTVRFRRRCERRAVAASGAQRDRCPARTIALNRSLVRSFLIVDCPCVPDSRYRGARRPIQMQNKPPKPPRPVRPRSSFADARGRAALTDAVRPAPRMSYRTQFGGLARATILRFKHVRTVYNYKCSHQTAIPERCAPLRTRPRVPRGWASRRPARSATAPARDIALNRSLVRSFLIVDCSYVPDSRYRGARRPIQTQNKPPTPPRPVRGLNASNAARGRVGGDRPSGRRGTRAVAMALAHSRAHTFPFACRSR